jgi:hypothetical protein
MVAAHGPDRTWVSAGISQDRLNVGRGAGRHQLRRRACDPTIIVRDAVTHVAPKHQNAPPTGISYQSSIPPGAISKVHPSPAAMKVARPAPATEQVQMGILSDLHGRSYVIYITMLGAMPGAATPCLGVHLSSTERTRLTLRLPATSVTIQASTTGGAPAALAALRAGHSRRPSGKARPWPQIRPSPSECVPF